MGRPEGPGCYCYANNVLRDAIARLSSSYRWVVVDCEAGLEHISRRTLLTLDWLIAVSDQSLRGVRTAARISDLVDEMKTRVSRRALVINRAATGQGSPTAEQSMILRQSNITSAWCVPDDPEVASMDARGGTIGDIPKNSPIRDAVDKLMSCLGIA
jgi:CO dehydrogenase maturation factor